MDETQRLEASLTEDGRYRLLVEAVVDYAIYMLDRDGLITSWNNGARRFKGYEAKEIIGQHFSIFYGEEDRQSGLPRRALDTAAREGKFEAEGWRIRKDGTRFWAHVVIDPIRSPLGELVGYAKITRDLTERRAAADQLRRSEEQFRLLVQSVTDYAIYMLDEKGFVSNWNAGAERIKGYTEDEIVGRHFSLFYTPEDLAENGPQRALDTAAREGRFEKEAWRVRKDGTRFWAHVIVDPIRDDMGRIVGYAKVTRDITERKHAQEALDKAREELFQAQKMEAIGRLTGGVAHDFNNLLMAITGSLEILQKRMPPDPRLMPFIRNAMLGAQRGVALTQRMLAFARRQELETKPTDIGKLIGNMQDLLQRTLGPTISIETDFPRKAQVARVDPNQLELALLNLAVNARDAMPAGGVLSISIKQMHLDGGLLPRGDYLCITVSDSGEGMDEATLRRATEPFFTTKGAGKGTGLGLSMVHGMVDQLGGKLVLNSRLGVGTTIEMWLPLAEIGDSAEAKGQLEKQAMEPKQSLTVLAVDDDHLVLMNTAAMLEELGHTALSASSGKRALDLLSTVPKVDLIITDHAMPKMTGIQLARAVALERPELPIIIATGYAEMPEEGASGFLKLQKPFDLDHLERTIEAASKAKV
jgi:PAS domain S-box-containing protein